MKLLLALATAAVVATNAFAAPQAVQIKIGVDISYGKERTQSIHTLLTVPIGETKVIGGIYDVVRDSERDLRTETKVKITPELTEEGYPKLVVVVLKDDEILSGATVTMEFGKPVEVISNSDDGPTVTLNLTATKARMMPIRRYDLIDKVHHGLYFEDQQ